MKNEETKDGLKIYGIILLLILPFWLCSVKQSYAEKRTEKSNEVTVEVTVSDLRKDGLKITDSKTGKHYLVTVNSEGNVVVNTE